MNNRLTFGRISQIWATFYLALSINPALAEAPSSKQLACGIANSWKLVETTCKKMPSFYQGFREYERYKCSGIINADFSVEYTNDSFSNTEKIKITYLPMNFTGISPIEINKIKAECNK